MRASKEGSEEVNDCLEMLVKVVDENAEVKKEEIVWE